MSKKIDFDKIKRLFNKESLGLDWDDLAYSIIVLEEAVRQEQQECKKNEERDPNILKILELKLEIHEYEKASRVFNSFNMEYFLNKDFEDFEEEGYEESDI